MKSVKETIKLVGGNTCPTCGKEYVEVKGNCEINKNREFYGGRVSFFQNVTCNCGAKYKLCIEQGIDNYKIIDMIILEKSKKIEIKKPEEEKNNNTDKEEINEIKKDENEPPKETGENTEEDDNITEDEDLNNNTEETKDGEFNPPVIKGHVVANYMSLKKSLMLMSKKELHKLLRSRHMRFNKALCTKEELVEKLIHHDPKGTTLNKYILPEFEKKED